MNYFPTTMAIVNGLLVGIIIPFCSAIIPVKEAMSKVLNESLNFDWAKTDTKKLQVHKTGGFGPEVYVFGFVSVLYAVAVYIYLPKSLLQLDLGMMLMIFLVILIGLLLGLTLFSLNILHIIQLAVIKVALFWESKSIKDMLKWHVMSSLANKTNNKITSVIYSMSLGFIILCVVAVNLEF